MDAGLLIARVLLGLAISARGARDRDGRRHPAHVAVAGTLSVWEMNHLLAKLAVGDVMTKSPITVDPDRDAREAAWLMLEHKIGALPVLKDGRLVGILTETDLLRAFAAGE
jgi:CBS domain-containing protein